jgi:hypothetical protein
MKKPVVVIMGACAAGKSTLGAHLLGSPVVEAAHTFIVRAQNRAGHLMPPGPEHVPFCINSKTGVAVAGNATGGSDCIHSRAGLTAVTNYLLGRRDVKLVVVNSVRFSQSADIVALSVRKDLRPAYVWFNLTQAENFRRLMQRREGQPLTALGTENFKRFYFRNQRNFEVLKTTYGPRLVYWEATDTTAPALLSRKILRSLLA